VLYSEAKTNGDISAGFLSVNIIDPKDMQKLLRAMQKMKNDPSIQPELRNRRAANHSGTGFQPVTCGSPGGKNLPHG